MSNITTCHTKILENGTLIFGGTNFGICQETCKGQRFEPKNKHNLIFNEKHWSNDLYDLRLFTDGFCHTFDPLIPQERGRGHILSLYLGYHELMRDIELPWKVFKITSICIF